jgi:pyridoxal phosphate enzyme (YggS family)
MQHKSINNLILIENEVKEINSATKIIAVSKTFSLNDIMPLIDHGHIHFGENKVQEAINKWKNLKNLNDKLKLHLIGRLQTNKVKLAISLFDYIHSLDSIKLAKKISIEQTSQNRNLKIFIQINLGGETQKGGIEPNNLKTFYQECVNELKLNIIGLMCIPPQNNETYLYFEQMSEFKKKLNLKELSMGMSSDYLEALKYGASFVRIGSKIFGSRTM